VTSTIAARALTSTALDHTPRPCFETGRRRTSSSPYTGASGSEVTLTSASELILGTGGSERIPSSSSMAATFTWRTTAAGIQPTGLIPAAIILKA
jgi:hypothetical protein